MQCGANRRPARRALDSSIRRIKPGKSNNFEFEIIIAKNGNGICCEV